MNPAKPHTGTVCEKSLAGYVAKHVIAEARVGAYPPSELAIAINRTPWIDSIRPLVGTPDFSWIRVLCNSPDPALVALGISFTRTIQHNPEVRDYLLKLWNSRRDYNARWWVMFRLMAYEDLDPPVQRDLFTFATSNWNQWLSDCTRFFGNGLHDELRERSFSGSWPASAAWVRVLQAVGLPDTEAASRFIADIERGSSAPLVPEAAAFARGKLGSKYAV